MLSLREDLVGECAARDADGSEASESAAAPCDQHAVGAVCEQHARDLVGACGGDVRQSRVIHSVCTIGMGLTEAVHRSTTTMRQLFPVPLYLKMPTVRCGH